MAVNKRKVLENARKFVQKGAVDKALKEYEKLLKVDPRDAKIRLEIGDAYRRWGKVEEAIDAYLKVANQYMNEGFDARAVAVFKQILNLDAECYSAYEPLADLYQRMGLIAESIQSLQVAADGYHKQGRKQDALALLRKMATLDPANTSSRIKVADLLKQEGMIEEAVTEYEGIVTELQRHGDGEALEAVFKRILEVAPARTATLHQYAKSLLGMGRAAEAESIAQRAREADPGDIQHFELLAEVYRTTKDENALTKVYRELANLHRQHGDEELAREILQRFVPADEFVAPPPGFGSELDTVGEEDLLDTGDHDDLFDGQADFDAGMEDDEFLSDDTFDDVSLDLESEPAVIQDIDADVQSTDSASGLSQDEIEQRLAEATVYLRYGKCGQAIEHLEEIVAANPRHLPALEKIGEAHAENGDAAGAVEAWLHAARVAHESGEASALVILRDRIAALDENAAHRLDDLVANATAIETDVDEDEYLEVHDSVTADGEPSVGGNASDLVSEFDLAGTLEGEGAVEIDGGTNMDDGLDLDAGLDVDAELDTGLGLDSDTGIDPGTEIEADDETDADNGIEFEVDASPEVLVGIGAELEFEIEGVGDRSGDPITANVSGLLDDSNAQEIGAENVEASPESSPLVLEAAAGELAEDSEIAVDLELTPGLEDSPRRAETLHEAEETVSSKLGVASLDTSVGSPSTSQQVLEDLEEAEFYLEQGITDEAEAIFQRLIRIAPNHPMVLVRLGELAAARGEDPALPNTDAGVSAPSGTQLPLRDEGFNTLDPGDVSPLEVTAPEISLSEAAVADAVLGEPNAAFSGGAAPNAPSDRGWRDIETGEYEIDLPLAEPEVEPETSGDSVLIPLSDESTGPAFEPIAALAAEGGQRVAEDSFDLAAELNQAMDEDAFGTSYESMGESADGFSAVFQEFKKGVSASLSDGDYETHYDLGIAYREMGLFDDAIAEFRTSMEGPARYVDSLHMMGLCSLDLDRASQAIEHFGEALSSSEITDGQQLAVRFELGRAFCSAGDVESARDAFEAVAQVDPLFCDVEEELAKLEKLKSDVDVETGESLVRVESDYESFEDLFSDDDDLSAPASVQSERKRKKISFV